MSKRSAASPGAQYSVFDFRRYCPDHGARAHHLRVFFVHRNMNEPPRTHASAAAHSRPLTLALPLVEAHTRTAPPAPTVEPYSLTLFRTHEGSQTARAILAGKAKQSLGSTSLLTLQLDPRQIFNTIYINSIHFYAFHYSRRSQRATHPGYGPQP